MFFDIFSISNKKCDFLKTYELNRALYNLIKYTQSQTFHEEINCLKSGKLLPIKSKIRQLHPFLDEIEI